MAVIISPTVYSLSISGLAHRPTLLPSSAMIMVRFWHLSRTHFLGQLTEPHYHALWLKCPRGTVPHRHSTGAITVWCAPDGPPSISSLGGASTLPSSSSSSPSIAKGKASSRAWSRGVAKLRRKRRVPSSTESEDMPGNGCGDVGAVCRGKGLTVDGAHEKEKEADRQSGPPTGTHLATTGTEWVGEQMPPRATERTSRHLMQRSNSPLTLEDFFAARNSFFGRDVWLESNFGWGVHIYIFTGRRGLRPPIYLHPKLTPPRTNKRSRLNTPALTRGFSWRRWWWSC